MHMADVTDIVKSGSLKIKFCDNFFCLIVIKWLLEGNNCNYLLDF